MRYQKRSYNCDGWNILDEWLSINLNYVLNEKFDWTTNKFTIYQKQEWILTSHKILENQSKGALTYPSQVGRSDQNIGLPIYWISLEWKSNNQKIQELFIWYHNSDKWAEKPERPNIYKTNIAINPFFSLQPHI